MTTSAVLDRAREAIDMPEEKDSKRGPQISVQFRLEDLNDLRAVAEETDTPIATLIRQWTLERLRQVKPREHGMSQ
ncbi:MAG TPA: hypothetical protein VFE42_05745 [Chloroflexota bacterium]|nr:hypothetical protein [Chloroflexota bacterium]